MMDVVRAIPFFEEPMTAADAPQADGGVAAVCDHGFNAA
jgi:hypothetical protein